MKQSILNLSNTKELKTISLIIVLCLNYSLASVLYVRDFKWGEPVSGEYILETAEILRRPVFGHEISALHLYEESNKVISRIHVHDKLEDVSGSRCVIARGGPGNNFVDIFFTNKMSGGINSTVYIYGL